MQNQKINNKKIIIIKWGEREDMEFLGSIVYQKQKQRFQFPSPKPFIDVTQMSLSVKKMPHIAH
jgi:hypothetical protein